MVQGLKPDQERDRSRPKEAPPPWTRAAGGQNFCSELRVFKLNNANGTEPQTITDFTDGTETVESREKGRDGTENADFVRSLFFSIGALGKRVFANTHAGWQKPFRVLGMLQLRSSDMPLCPDS